MTWGPRPDQTPLVIAHRGASAHVTENTLEAFARARTDGADGVELDTLLCATGEVVVFHDDDLERLCGAPDAIAALPLAAVRGARLAAGGSIPTLDEVFEALPDLLVNVELKANRPLAGQKLAPAVAEVIRRHNATARTLVSSFNPAAILAFKKATRDVPTALLFHAGQARPFREAWARGTLRPMALHPQQDLVTAERLRRWRAEGYAVNAWTVDDWAGLDRMAALGVDGVITNDPARTRAILELRAPKPGSPDVRKRRSPAD